jgi:hypothetical protein
MSFATRNAFACLCFLAVDLAACERNLAESVEAAVRREERILPKFKTNETYIFLKFE